MAQGIFDNMLGHGEIMQTKLRNKLGREFFNITDYFDDLDTNRIKFDEMASDVHVMTKNENGDYVSEPMNVVLSRINATHSTAKCTDPRGAGLTEAEFAMKLFWYQIMDESVGMHTYVNTEPDATKPKKMEVKYLTFTDHQNYSSTGELSLSITDHKRITLDEDNLEDRLSDKLDRAKVAGRHCDSKGWLNFKKFFSSKATKQKLQKEYDDFQALKVTVAQDEAKYKAATQSKCDVYSSTDPDKIKTIEKETFEANKREVAKYNETEKAANMQLAAKVIANSADKLPDYEKKHAHYVNALIDNEGFNKHTMGQTQSILGNEKEEADLIKYINQPNKLESIISAANKSYEKNGAIGFDKPEPENVVIEDALEGVENNNQQKLSETGKQYAEMLASSGLLTFPNKWKYLSQLSVLMENNAVFEKHFLNAADNEMSQIARSKELKSELFSEDNKRILGIALDKVCNVPAAELKASQAKEALKEATKEVNKSKGSQSADFVADRVLDALAINVNDKITPETKTAMRNAISSKNVVKNFVNGKTLDDIKSMQNDPKKKQEYQAVITSVLKDYAPTLFDNKAARPKPIAKKANAVAPKNKENAI